MSAAKKKSAKKKSAKKKSAKKKSAKKKSAKKKSAKKKSAKKKKKKNAKKKTTKKTKPAAVELDLEVEAASGSLQIGAEVYDTSGKEEDPPILEGLSARNTKVHPFQVARNKSYVLGFWVVNGSGTFTVNIRRQGDGFLVATDTFDTKDGFNNRYLPFATKFGG